ncbi:nucleoid-associated protein [bacterium SCSIO 12696]|nr:nucleoid-associated protein [bacterium SCSIO 12696]
MAISHAIAHRLERTPGSNARCQQRSDELPLDGKLEELLRELKRTYCNRAGKTWGLFSADIGNFPFSGLLKNYCEGGLGFASFSHQAAKQFASQLDSCDAGVDAHLLMCHENLADADYLYLFMVDHDEVLYIDNELSIQSTWNIGSLMLGARVNLEEWQNGGSNYLSLLRLRGDKPLTDAFFNTLGFDDPQIDLYADTGQFLDAVDSYSKTLPDEQAQETRHKVVDYCIEQDRNAEPVVFDKLSRELNEDKPREFADYLEKRYEEQKGFEERAKEQAPKKELIPHRGRLKQYIRLSGRDPEMSISFNADCIGNSVEYDHENDVLTLKKLPKALRSKLLEHLRSEGRPSP